MRYWVPHWMDRLPPSPGSVTVLCCEVQDVCGWLAWQNIPDSDSKITFVSNQCGLMVFLTRGTRLDSIQGILSVAMDMHSHNYSPDM